MRLFLIVLAVLALAVPPTPAGADAPVVDPDHLITAGMGIGPVKIGMSLEDAEKAWGQPYRALGGMSYDWKIHDSDGFLEVIAGPAGGTSYIIAIAVQFDGSYRTAEGLHAATAQKNSSILHGSTAKDVRAALGEPQKTETPKPGHQVWKYKGLWVTLDQDRDGVLYVTELLVRSTVLPTP